MQTPSEIYWKKRIETCKAALEGNNFDVYLADHSHDAHEIIFKEIWPQIAAASVSWGDSLTFLSTHVLETFRQDPRITVIETFAKDVAREKLIERRRAALLADLFFTGSNAITECGKLVNLDMVGNRIAGLMFGPRYVVVTVGRNKIVSDLNAAFQRVKERAAPLNAIRHTQFQTPCRKTAVCHDCSSPDRICNSWSIIEKSYPKGRIKVILINQDLGF